MESVCFISIFGGKGLCDYIRQLIVNANVKEKNMITTWPIDEKIGKEFINVKDSRDIVYMEHQLKIVILGFHFDRFLDIVNANIQSNFTPLRKMETEHCIDSKGFQILFDKFSFNSNKIVVSL